jgi:hypothetical protein
MKQLFKFNHIKINKAFVKRVFIISLPSVLIFSALFALDWLPGNIALLCCLFAITSNIFMLFPISSELHALRQYIESLAVGKVNELDIDLSEKDTKD